MCALVPYRRLLHNINYDIEILIRIVDRIVYIYSYQDGELVNDSNLRFLNNLLMACFTISMDSWEKRISRCNVPLAWRDRRGDAD